MEASIRTELQRTGDRYIGYVRRMDMKIFEKGFEGSAILVVINNDEPLMEYKLNGICEDPESSYWTMDPSEIFSVWSTPYLMEGSL